VTGVTPSTIHEFETIDAAKGREPAEADLAEAKESRARVLSGHYRFDSSRAVRELGYRVVPLASMVQEAYDWYRAHGFIAARVPHAPR
jgi:nucleoside-diphosphate-sugar epimerase